MRWNVEVPEGSSNTPTTLETAGGDRRIGELLENDGLQGYDAVKACSGCSSSA